MTGGETSGASISDAASVGNRLTADSRAGSCHTDDGLRHCALIGEIYKGQSLTGSQGKCFGVSLRHVATDIITALRVRVAIFVFPAILAARILPMLVAIIGRPTIHPVCALAMLITIIFIPTLLAAAVQPVIGMRARSLNIAGGLGDADRVGARRQIVEAI